MTAALEAAPKGYLFELCYSHEHDRWSGPMYSECLPDAADVRNVIPLYAARSAPEAGKAVDADKAHELLTKLWMVAAKLPPEPREDIASIIVALRALASVAPSGAEPCPTCLGDGEISGQCGGGYSEEIVAVPCPDCAPQVVPEEDVASFITSTEAELAAGSASAMDWNTRSIALVRSLLAALTSLCAELADLRRAILGGDPQPGMRPGQFIEMVKTTEAARLGALARAETAKRKLEEHRKALESFAEVANWYDARESDDFEVWQDYPHGFISHEPAKLKHYRRARTLTGASE